MRRTRRQQSAAAVTAESAARLWLRLQSVSASLQSGTTKSGLQG